MELTPTAVLLQLFWLVFYGSGTLLIVAAVAGLVVAILQGVTQINDQTLPQLVKTGAVMATLLMFGTSFYSPLYFVTINIFDQIPVVGR